MLYGYALFSSRRAMSAKTPEPPRPCLFPPPGEVANMFGRELRFGNARVVVHPPSVNAGGDDPLAGLIAKSIAEGWEVLQQREKGWAETGLPRLKGESPHMIALRRDADIRWIVGTNPGLGHTVQITLPAGDLAGASNGVTYVPQDWPLPTPHNAECVGTGVLPGMEIGMFAVLRDGNTLDDYHGALIADGWRRIGDNESGGVRPPLLYRQGNRVCWVMKGAWIETGKATLSVISYRL